MLNTNNCFYFRYTTGFPVFIFDLICLISSNPLEVKYFLSLISSTALHQELKSSDFTPKTLYLLKNGTIFSNISKNFPTLRIEIVGLLGIYFTPPHSQ